MSSRTWAWAVVGLAIVAVLAFLAVPRPTAERGGGRAHDQGLGPLELPPPTVEPLVREQSRDQRGTQGREPSSRPRAHSQSPEDEPPSDDFHEIVDWVLRKHPSLSLLKIESSEHGNIAVFQYQGDSTSVIQQTGGEYGQFLTAGGGFVSEPGVDDPDVEASLKELDHEIAPFIALVDVPRGEDVPYELMDQFAEILVEVD